MQSENALVSTLCLKFRKTTISQTDDAAMLATSFSVMANQNKHAGSKRKNIIVFDSWKYRHWSKLENIVVRLICRKQDVVNLENIHIKPYKLLTAMLASKSAVLCTLEIF